MTVDDDHPIARQRSDLTRQHAERNEARAGEPGVGVLVRLANVEQQRGPAGLDELRELPGLDLR